ncbi:MAG: helix-hairpin-helix domain-containing protein, partial [Halobacteriales archaeon]|nr:helix-hairpin-helix domain-containing protein [Halobacteriales archaeon]
MPRNRDELQDLPGVDAKAAEALRRAGIRTIDDLRTTDETTLGGIEGVGPRLASAIAFGAYVTDASEDVEEAAGRHIGMDTTGLPD